MLEKLQTSWSRSRFVLMFDVFLCGVKKRRWFAEQRTRSWWMEDKLGGRSVATAMPSCWWFDEDTWEQHTRTMSWGVTLTWDEALFIPRTLLVFLFPVSLASASHDSLRSLWSSAYLLPTSSSLVSNSPTVGMQLSTVTTRVDSHSTNEKDKHVKECLLLSPIQRSANLPKSLKIQNFPKTFKNLQLIWNCLGD